MPESDDGGWWLLQDPGVMCLATAAFYAGIMFGLFWAGGR